MIRRAQWVVWKRERRPGSAADAKSTKVPYSPTAGALASSTDPATWGTYAGALAMVRASRADGIGYVFSEGDPFFGIDLDGCRDPETGELETWALEIVERFDTYTEPSPSGTGVHIIGRGAKPAPNSRKGAHIECYDRERYFTMTLEPIAGYSRIRACGDVLTAWHREMWPQDAPAGSSAPITLTLEDRDILDMLERETGGKAAALVRGDNRDYPSPSEARAALAWKACFYTDDESQIARIVQASGLFRDGTPEHERARKARQDAKSARSSYTGPRYDPAQRRQAGPLITPAPAAHDSELATRSADELRAIIRQQTAIIEAERAARIAAEERANRMALERSHIMRILRNSELSTGERLTGFAIALDLQARAANGEQPKPYGYRAYARRYAEMTGQSEGTAARQMRNLADKGLIIKHVVREETQLEDIDAESGEIQAVRGMRDTNYIEVPEGKIISIVDRLATYQHADDDGRHGGKREPRPACKHHPKAGTYTVRCERIECAQCHTILEESQPTRTYHPTIDPDELEPGCSDSKLIPELLFTPPVVNVLSSSKMTPEPAANQTARSTGSIMTPEPHPEMDPPRCKCGEPIPADRKWTCREECTGEPRQLEVAS